MADAHVTEAGCLLEQGASYRRRIGLQPVATPGDPIFAGFKQGAFSLYFGDAPIFHFDLEGRWQRAFLGGVHYLKGLDATVHAIDRVRQGPNLVLKRRTLTEAETEELDSGIRSTALELIARLDADRLRRVEPVSPRAIPLATHELRDFLTRIGSWDVAAWLAHRERYETVYGPDTFFLPPECQNAVVLRATNPHPTGYDFENHARDVARLWGRRLLQSRVVFLAGNNALHLPLNDLAARLRVIGETFPIESRARGRAKERAAEEEHPSFDGVHGFMDNFRRARPDCDGWRELAARGLVRISLGVESGDPEVRALYQKDWADDELRATVREIKGAELGASVLTLVGAGGVERAETHLERTLRLIESLELGTGDFVFLIDEKEIGGPASTAEGTRILDGQAWLEQQANVKNALAPLKKRGVKVLPYTVEKQWT